MRDLWDTSIPQVRGFATKPKKLASSGIKRLIERAIWAQGLRKKLQNGKKGHPFSAIHTYRKWFKTRCEIAGMKPINIEKLLSHSIGISNSYYRPTGNELLEDYLKVPSCSNRQTISIAKRVKSLPAEKPRRIIHYQRKIIRKRRRAKNLKTTI
jgi:hypothetical protein